MPTVKRVRRTASTESISILDELSATLERRIKLPTDYWELYWLQRDYVSFIAMKKFVRTLKAFGYYNEEVRVEDPVSSEHDLKKAIREAKKNLEFRLIPFCKEGVAVNYGIVFTTVIVGKVHIFYIGQRNEQAAFLSDAEFEMVHVHTLPTGQRGNLGMEVLTILANLRTKEDLLNFVGEINKARNLPDKFLDQLEIVEKLVTSMFEYGTQRWEDFNRNEDVADKLAEIFNPLIPYKYEIVEDATANELEKIEQEREMPKHFQHKMLVTLSHAVIKYYKQQNIGVTIYIGQRETVDTLEFPPLSEGTIQAFTINAFKESESDKFGTFVSETNRFFKFITVVSNNDRTVISKVGELYEGQCFYTNRRTLTNDIFTHLASILYALCPQAGNSIMLPAYLTMEETETVPSQNQWARIVRTQLRKKPTRVLREALLALFKKIYERTDLSEELGKEFETDMIFAGLSVSIDETLSRTERAADQKIPTTEEQQYFTPRVIVTLDKNDFPKNFNPSTAINSNLLTLSIDDLLSYLDLEIGTLKAFFNQLLLIAKRAGNRNQRKMCVINPEALKLSTITRNTLLNDYVFHRGPSYQGYFERAALPFELNGRKAMAIVFRASPVAESHLLLVVNSGKNEADLMVDASVLQVIKVLKALFPGVSEYKKIIHKVTDEKVEVHCAWIAHHYLAGTSNPTKIKNNGFDRQLATVLTRLNLRNGAHSTQARDRLQTIQAGADYNGFLEKIKEARKAPATNLKKFINQVKDEVYKKDFLEKILAALGLRYDSDIEKAMDKYKLLWEMWCKNRNSDSDKLKSCNELLPPRQLFRQAFKRLTEPFMSDEELVCSSDEPDSCFGAKVTDAYHFRTFNSKTGWKKAVDMTKSTKSTFVSKAYDRCLSEGYYCISYNDQPRKDYSKGADWAHAKGLIVISLINDDAESALLIQTHWPRLTASCVRAHKGTAGCIPNIAIENQQSFKCTRFRLSTVLHIMDQFNMASFPFEGLSDTDTKVETKVSSEKKDVGMSPLPIKSGHQDYVLHCQKSLNVVPKAHGAYEHEAKLMGEMSERISKKTKQDLVSQNWSEQHYPWVSTPFKDDDGEDRYVLNVKFYCGLYGRNDKCWPTTKDHSKMAVSAPSNSTDPHWVCFQDLNRYMIHVFRGGCALCWIDENLNKALRCSMVTEMLYEKKDDGSFIAVSLPLATRVLRNVYRGCIIQAEQQALILKETGVDLPANILIQ